jgi:cytochrome d ubiquinol oxidase subunit II
MPSLGDAWFVLIGVLLLGYAVLDGFDLGVGILGPFVSRTERERALVERTIGPVWDGNEVWLLTAGGALFAAFPLVYATVFSGLYLALVLLLAALIGRAVALEFRGQLDDPRWRRAWDAVLFVGSLLPPLLLGVAVGNVIRGLPLDADGLYRGGLLGLLTPFPLLVGLLVEAFVVVHGAAWLHLKTEGPVASRARRILVGGVAAEAALWLLTTAAAAAFAPDHVGAFGNPVTWLAPVIVVLGLGATAWCARTGREAGALLASGLSMAGYVAILGLGLYPNLVPALDHPDRSLTIARASSSDLTLGVMLGITIVAVPVVLAYTGFVYRKLWGKVRDDELEYSG